MLDRNKHPILDKDILVPMQDITTKAIVQVPLGDYWLLYSSLHELDYERARAVVGFGMAISHELNSRPSEELEGYLARILCTIKRLPYFGIKPIPETLLEAQILFDRSPRYKDKTVQAVSFSYALLRPNPKSQLSHEQAAQFASAVLDKNIYPDAWRKRVTRWAEEQKDLPKIEQRKRTPRPENVRSG